jgi:hypothetical protein
MRYAVDLYFIHINTGTFNGNVSYLITKFNVFLQTLKKKNSKGKTTQRAVQEWSILANACAVSFWELKIAPRDVACALFAAKC